MVKKITSCCLVICMLLTFIFVPAYGESSDHVYTQSQKEEIISNLSRIDSSFMKSIAKPGYMMYHSFYIDAKSNHPHTSKASDLCAQLLKVYADKKRCTEILVTILSSMDCKTASDLETQSKFDNTKGLKDYTLDVLDILSGSVGYVESLEKAQKIISHAGIAKDIIMETTDMVKYYELLFENYSNSVMLLTLVKENAEYKPLREAAEDILKYKDEEFKQALKLTSDISVKTIKYTKDILWENYDIIIDRVISSTTNKKLSDTFYTIGVLKETVFKWAADYSVGVNLGIFAADMIGRNTNKFNRQQEIKVLSEITNILINECDKINIDNKEYSDEMFENTLRKCELYKILCAIHRRGEYCYYELLIHDGGFQSVFFQLSEAIKILTDKHSFVDTYDNMNREIDAAYVNLNRIFKVTRDKSDNDEIIKHKRQLIDVSNCSDGVVAVTKDGRVAATDDVFMTPMDGFDDAMKAYIESWTDVIEVARGYNFVAALKSDGTVYATEIDVDAGQQGDKERIESWTNVVSIRASMDSLWAITKDGKILNSRTFKEETDYKKWDNVSDLRVTHDGEFIVISNENCYAPDETRNDHIVFNWTEKYKDCLAISEGKAIRYLHYGEGGKSENSFLAILSNGKVATNFILTDNEYNKMYAACKSEYDKFYSDDYPIEVPQKSNYVMGNANEWENIVEVGFGYFGGVSFPHGPILEENAVGLTKDGKVIAYGYNVNGQCNVSSWTNIVDIDTSCINTVGITKDGHGISTDPDSVVNTWTDLAVY